MKLKDLLKCQKECLKETLYYDLIHEGVDADSLTEKTTEELLQERYGNIDFVNDDFACTAGMTNPCEVQFVVTTKNGREVFKEEKLLEKDQVEIYAEGLKNGLSARVRVADVTINYLNF